MTDSQGYCAEDIIDEDIERDLPHSATEDPDSGIYDPVQMYLR